MSREKCYGGQSCHSSLQRGYVHQRGKFRLGCKAEDFSALVQAGWYARKVTHMPIVCGALQFDQSFVPRIALFPERVFVGRGGRTLLCAVGVMAGWVALPAENKFRCG